MEARHIALLESESWFGALSVERRRRLLRHAGVQTLPSGSYLYRLGDAPNGLYALLDGELRMVSYSSAGQEMVAMVVRPGLWFGELSVIDGGPRPHDAIAATETRIARLSMEAIALLTNAEPDLWRDLARLGCEHQRWAMRHNERVRTQPAVVRLAGFLLSKAVVSLDGRVPHTQETLAEILGVSRQRVNALLKELDRRGLAQSAYGCVIVRDISGLRAFVNSHG